MTDADRAAARDARRKAQVPLLRDLSAIGIRVDSIWDLPAGEYQDARLPEILMKHLRSGDYDGHLLLGIATSLCSQLDSSYWTDLREIYLSTTDPRKMDAVAVVMSKVARKAQYEDLKESVEDLSRGQSRILFLRPIRRIGRADGRAFVESLRGDAVLDKQVTNLMGSKPKGG